MTPALPASYWLTAILVASVLVFGLRVQDMDLRPVVGSIDSRWLRVYTPYFPGLNNLETHEVFSPAHAQRRKVVLLGASPVASIGCDSSWTTPDETRSPVRNAHHFCSISAQMNEQLRAAGDDEWQVYSLAQAGSRLTPMLYVYARLLALKPDVVVFGDAFPYYLTENAGASSLSATHYAYLDEVFNATAETAGTWARYRANLSRHGWQLPAASAGGSVADVGPPVTLNNILLRAFAELKAATAQVGPPLPVKLVTFREWPDGPRQSGTFENPDADLEYFRGLTLIGALQKIHGSKFFVYFSPQWDRRNDAAYITAIQDVFGRYLTTHGIPFVSYVALDLKPVAETYDGEHQTLQGNRILAARLLQDLKAAKLIH